MGFGEGRKVRVRRPLSTVGLSVWDKKGFRGVLGSICSISMTGLSAVSLFRANVIPLKNTEELNANSDAFANNSGMQCNAQYYCLAASYTRSKPQSNEYARAC